MGHAHHGFDGYPILHGAVQARVVGARFAAAVRSFRPRKRFLMVLARVLALFRSFDRENNFAMAPLPPTL